MFNGRLLVITHYSLVLFSGAAKLALYESADNDLHSVHEYLSSDLHDTAYIFQGTANLL